MASLSNQQTDNQACGASLPDLRPFDEVMQLSRMGSFFPHRLSFMRVLIRRLADEKAVMQMPICQLDSNGFGHVVFSIPVSGRTYSLIAYSRYLEDDARTDRVIATQWDASFCLFDGVPSLADIDQLAEQVTRQEAGRYDARILTLSRANKSLWLFRHVVDRLAKGQQPDTEALAAFHRVTRVEGIMPALETAHALAYAEKLAGTMTPDQHIIVNLSGRGDKDILTVAEIDGIDLGAS